MFELTPNRPKGSGPVIESRLPFMPTRRDVMSMTQAMLAEFDTEAKTTRRVLERVPADKLSWKPHPKSMSLGTLALHVATSPGVIIGWCCEDETNFTGQGGPPDPTSTEEILAAHDASVQKVKDTVPQIGDEGM